MLKKKQYTVKAWIITLTAALFFFYEFIQLIMPNAINAQLTQSFHLNATSLGYLVSMYFWANALFLFPAGNLLDRYSTKKLLLTAVVFCIVGTLIFGIAHSFLFAATGRFIVGIGAAFCFLSCIRIASRWFPPSKMATVTGMVVTMAMLGGLAAQSPMVMLTNYMGWRNAILCNAGLGVFIFLAILFIVQDRPADSQEEAITHSDQLKALGFWKCIKLVLLNPQNWLGGIYTSLLNLPVFILGGLWGMPYLVQARHLTEAQASYVTSMLFVGIIFGSPAFGWFSDRLGRRCMPMVIGALTSLLVILALMYVPNLSYSAILTLFFLVGFLTSSQVLSYPTIAELNPIALTGTAVSVASITIMLSGVIFEPFFGWLLQLNWDHTMVNNIAVYSLSNFNLAMLIMPVSFIMALFLTFFMRETYCQSQA
jgi:MFS family permease